MKGFFANLIFFPLLAIHEFHTVAHWCDAHLSLESASLQPQSLDAAGGERKIIPYG